MRSALEERMKCEGLSSHPILACLVEHAGRLMCQGITLVVTGAQLANCMLVSRTADSWLNFGTSALHANSASAVMFADHDVKWNVFL